jgi:hypothetical protein
MAGMDGAAAEFSGVTATAGAGGAIHSNPAWAGPDTPTTSATADSKDHTFKLVRAMDQTP